MNTTAPEPVAASPVLTTRLLAEIIGTFGFFFLGFSSIASGGAAAAVGFGAGLGLMIAAFGHISGGHYNPAVTLGLAIGKKHPMGEVLPYWGAQLVGGLAAAVLARGLYDFLPAKAYVNHPARGIQDWRAMLIEAVATLLFLLVISAVATDKKTPWNGLFSPVLIGLFIFCAASVIGPITSGSFNPARSLAPAIIAGDFKDLWVFIVGPLLGGLVGGFIYLQMRARE
jgi:MIP family channel proteins